jgi:hypothetical protein
MTLAPTHRVYLIRRASDGAVKIGVSRSPSDRLTALRYEYRLAHQAGTEMEIIGSVAGSYQLEAYFHEYFDEKWVEGEWFMLTAEDVEYVLTMPLPTPRRSGVDFGDGERPTEPGHREAEKTSILAALESCGWNRVQASKSLGIPRRTFYRRLYEYGRLAA